MIEQIKCTKLFRYLSILNVPSFMNTVASEVFPSFNPLDLWWSGTMSFAPKASVPSNLLSSFIVALTVLVFTPALKIIRYVPVHTSSLLATEVHPKGSYNMYNGMSIWVNITTHIILFTCSGLEFAWYEYFQIHWDWKVSVVIGIKCHLQYCKTIWFISHILILTELNIYTCNMYTKWYCQI